MQGCANKFFCSSLEVLLMVAWHLLGCFGDKIKINISLTVFFGEGNGTPLQYSYFSLPS